MHVLFSVLTRLERIVSFFWRQQLNFWLKWNCGIFHLFYFWISSSFLFESSFIYESPPTHTHTKQVTLMNVFFFSEYAIEWAGISSEVVADKIMSKLIIGINAD